MGSWLFLHLLLQGIWQGWHGPQLPHQALILLALSWRPVRRIVQQLDVFDNRIDLRSCQVASAQRQTLTHPVHRHVERCVVITASIVCQQRSCTPIAEQQGNLGCSCMTEYTDAHVTHALETAHALELHARMACNPLALTTSTDASDGRFCEPLLQPHGSKQLELKKELNESMFLCPWCVLYA